MGHGLNKQYAAGIASGATLSSQFDLGRAFAKVYLGVPTMVSNSAIHVQAASSSAGTFRRVCVVNSAAVTVSDFVIASSVTNRFVPIPAGFQYYKIETTATVDDGNTFNVICGDS